MNEIYFKGKKINFDKIIQDDDLKEIYNIYIEMRKNNFISMKNLSDIVTKFIEMQVFPKLILGKWEVEQMGSITHTGARHGENFGVKFLGMCCYIVQSNKQYEFIIEE